MNKNVLTVTEKEWKTVFTATVIHNCTALGFQYYWSVPVHQYLQVVLFIFLNTSILCNSFWNLEVPNTKKIKMYHFSLVKVHVTCDIGIGDFFNLWHYFISMSWMHTWKMYIHVHVWTIIWLHVWVDINYLCI